jgi:hypothetical protein
VTHLYDLLAPFVGFVTALVLVVLLLLISFGSARKFGVLLLYVSWELFATIGLTVADLRLNGTQQLEHATRESRLYADLYWSNEIIVDALRFVLVSVLIYKVAGSPRFVRWLLTGLALAMLVLPFILFPLMEGTDGFPGSPWFNSTSQLLNFGAAIMNVLLWGALLGARIRDRQILEVSVGLGLLTAGSAFGLGLRHFKPTGDWTAVFNLFLNLTQLAAWVIWCHAFWPVARQRIRGQAGPS